MNDKTTTPPKVDRTKMFASYTRYHVVRTAATVVTPELAESAARVRAIPEDWQPEGNLMVVE